MNRIAGTEICEYLRAEMRIGNKSIARLRSTEAAVWLSIRNGDIAGAWMTAIHAVANV